MTEEELVNQLRALPPWRAESDFTDEDWSKYIALAQRLQSVDSGVVEAGVGEFVRQSLQEPYQGYDSQSKPFLLMRVLFDIPERAPAANHFSFKGWTNWPAPDANNQVNLSWPVSWQTGKPQLLDRYDGSMGRPYAAADEYRYLLQTFPYRKL